MERLRIKAMLQIRATISQLHLLLCLEYATGEEIASFIKEMKLMQHIGKHPCVVSMLACRTRPVTGAFIVMDYCSKGDLRSYLKNMRFKKYKNFNKAGNNPDETKGEDK